MPQTTLQSLEERVARLERNLAHLLPPNHLPQRVKEWQRTVGMFAGNDAMKEIDRLGQEYREADRRETRE